MNRGLRVETCILRSRKLLLSIAGIAALAILLIVELLNPTPSRAQLQDANTPSDKKEITVSPKILKQYVGIYDLGQLEQNLKMTITLENGQLIASGAPQVTGEAKRPLSASSETKFFSKAVDDDFEFFKDDKGKVAGFRLTQHFTARITNAPKISDDPSFGDPSLGTWKLNIAKSKLPPTAANLKELTAVVRLMDANTYESISTETLKDGKTTTIKGTVPRNGGIGAFQQGGPANGISIVAAKIDPYTILEMYLQNGKQIFLMRLTISKDGKTMTGIASIPNAQGKPFEASGLFEKQ